MKRTVILILVSLLAFAVPSFAKFDPSFEWTTIETPHFLIHYHQGGEALAQRAAQIAEDVHERLVLRVRWGPKEKTHLVLVDAMDEPNGYASPIPYNRIVIFLTQPLGQPGFGAMHYDDWLRLVITHEYTHILQLDMRTGGLGGVLGFMFGRLYFPNLFQPEWMIEGLATYEETEQTTGGRGRSPGQDMVLRMATLEGSFPTLDRMAVFPDTWPSGDVPYLFGESFTRFVADKYGRDKLAEISTAYSGRGFPFLANSTASRILHDRYERLWREWRKALEDRYRKQEEEIREKGMTTSEQLTRKGYYSTAPAFSPDGATIAYSSANNDEFPGIYLMKADGSEARELIENVFPLAASGSNVSWSPDGKTLYYTKLEVRGANIYNDLYAYDLQRRKEIRLTRELRGRDPDPTPDGKRLLFVMNRMGLTRLALLNIEGRRHPAERGEVTFLTEEGTDQFDSPRFSPDGSRIAVAVWRPGGSRDLWLLDSSGTLIEEVTHDSAVNGAPAWSRDGRYLFFSSDRTGVFNIYAYDLATKRIFQVTNVLGGAFTPAPSPDGRTLAFASYSAKGYDIHTITLDPSAWKKATPAPEKAPLILYEERPIETSTRKYNPLPTLLPRLWIPWFGYSKSSGFLFGPLTFGQDAAERHQYVLSALYGPKHGRTSYAFDYLYDGLPPTIHIEAYDVDAVYTDFFRRSAPEEKVDYEEREKTYGLSAIAELIKFGRQDYIILGYRWQELSRLSDIPVWYTGTLPGEGILASGRAMYLFNTARQYGFSISLEEGRTVALGYERFDRSMGGDYEINKYTADWHEYLNMFSAHHVLSARAFVGASTGADALRLPQRVFQLGGDSLLENPQDAIVTVDSQSIYLRGYPVNEFRGKKAALASLEYRFPVRNVERGVGSAPFFLRRIHGAVFFEAGNAWDGTFRHEDLKRSVGVEARFDLYLTYFLPVTLRLGIASGLDEEGETGLTFGLWIPLGF